MGQLLENHPLRDVLFGKPIPGGYDAAGIRILAKGTNLATQKAPKDGVYVLGEGHFFVKAGDPLPPGAVMREAKKVTKKKDAKPEENAKSAGPSETN